MSISQGGHSILELPPHRSPFSKTSFWMIWFAYWNAVVLINAFQWYAYDLFGGNQSRIYHDICWAVAVWYPRALFAPLVLWLAVKWPMQGKGRLKWLLVHVSYGILLGALATLVQASVFQLVGQGRPIQDTRVHEIVLRHASYGTASYWIFSALVLGWNYIVYNILTYWTILGLVQGWHFYDDARRKEIQTVQLQSQLSNVRLDVLKMQLHPHFLFNTLHAVATLIHDKPDVAEDMILRLSQLLRVSLDETSEHEVPLWRELRFLEWHLGIEKIRFGDRLKTEIDVSEDALQCAVPHLILQPLIENAIQHGIGKYAGADLIEIQGWRRGQSLFLEVRNANSVIDFTANQSSKRGIGLANTELRLKGLYDEKAFIKLEGISPRGAVVRIILPARRIAPVPNSSAEFLYD